MHRPTIRILALGLGLACSIGQALASSDQAAAASSDQSFTTTSCIRREMDSIAQEVRLLTKIRDTGKPNISFVPVSVHGIEISLLLLEKCQLSTMDATRALTTVKMALRQGASELKQKPKDLAPVDLLRKAVLEYERQFRDEFRARSSLTPNT